MDPSRYTCADEWIKDETNRLHIVQKYDADGVEPVILKQAFRPDDPEEFNGIVAAHRLAQQVLGGNPVATVPSILATDPDSRAYLMEFQPGETLLEHCRSNLDHRPFLELAGKWLSAFHSGTFQKQRQFQPRFMARHMLHLVDQMKAGERKIKGQKRFVELAHAVQDFAAASEGRISKIAAKHGDMNSRNILISGQTVAAYDFLPQSFAPVGYDIAKILLSYAQTTADIGKIPNGSVLPPEAMEAFFDGYEFVGPDDPGVEFLLRIQILTDWNRMDTSKNAQTLIRFERLRAIARRAFA